MCHYFIAGANKDLWFTALVSKAKCKEFYTAAQPRRPARDNNEKEMMSVIFSDSSVP